jgi:hypothetical protein
MEAFILITDAPSLRGHIGDCHLVQAKYELLQPTLEGLSHGGRDDEHDPMALCQHKGRVHDAAGASDKHLHSGLHMSQGKDI